MQCIALLCKQCTHAVIMEHFMLCTQNCFLAWLNMLVDDDTLMVVRVFDAYRNAAMSHFYLRSKIFRLSLIISITLCIYVLCRTDHIVVTIVAWPFLRTPTNSTHQYWWICCRICHSHCMANGKLTCQNVCSFCMHEALHCHRHCHRNRFWPPKGGLIGHIRRVVCIAIAMPINVLTAACISLQDYTLGLSNCRDGFRLGMNFWWCNEDEHLASTVYFHSIFCTLVTTSTPVRRMQFSGEIRLALIVIWH